MPDLVYRVKWEIDEPPDMSSAQTVGGAGGADMGDVYQQNINNSKTYQAVIKNELNLTIQNTQAQQNRRRQISSLSKDTRDLVSVIKDEIAAVRATTAEMKLQDNVSDEMIAGAIKQSSALRALAEDQRILAIAADETHPAYRMMNQLLASVFNTIKASSNEVKNYGSQLYELSTSTDGLVSREVALTEAIKAKTDEVRRYNAIVEVRGAVDESEIVLYQRATQELQDMREELVAVANASENIDSSQIREMNKALKGAGQAATSATRYLSGMAGQQAGVNRLGNNSNQIFLAFGDALQDSAQFSYGFATGMRAVGNNLTFAAEQFGYAYQRAGSMSELMKEFGKTLRGPVGVIVGINAAVTLITVFAQTVENRLKKVREEGRETSKVFTEIASSFASAAAEGVTDPFGIIRSENQLKFLKAQFELMENPAEKLIDQLVEINKTGANIGTSVGSGVGAVIDVTKTVLANIFDKGAKAVEGFDLEYRAAFGDENAQKAVAMSEAYQEIRKEIEKLQLQQDAYTKYLESDGNEALKAANDQFKRNSDTLRKLSTGQIDLKQATYNTVTQVREQIEQLVALPSLTESQILALNALRDEYGKLTSKVKEYTDAQRELLSIEARRKKVDLESMALTASMGRNQDKYNLSIKEAKNLRDEEEQALQDFIREQEARLEKQKTDGLLTLDQFKAQKSALEDLNNEEQALIEKKEQTAIRQAKLNKILADVDNVQAITESISTLGEIFNAGKEFQIAMAIIDGGAAIVKTFAQLGFPAGLPAAIAVAARTAKVIADMKKTKAGDKSPIGSSGTSAAPSRSFGFKSTAVESGNAFGLPSYIPAVSGQRSQNVNVEIHADRKQLYALVRKGEEEYRQIKSS